MALIHLENIEKEYLLGEVIVRALAGVSLDIESGELLAIMGPSGSGKSTLMNIISCMDRPTRGKYVLDGQDVSRFDKDALAGIRSKTIGLVFQNFNLLQSATVLENVALPLMYSGVPLKQREEVARGLLEKLGLGNRTDHFPTQISGGQQQRAAIARAMANNPKILMADEPTGNLDSKSSEEVMAMLTALNRDTGLTLILVTHEPDVARHARRVIHIRDGKISEDEKR